MLAIAAFVFSLLLALVSFFFRGRKSSSKKDAVLLVGLPNSGKTALMSKLVFDHTYPTQMSMQINTASLPLGPKKAIRVIDIPGHARLRGQFQEHLGEAKAVLFTVDAPSISRNPSEVAEHLHLVLHALTSLPPSQTPPKLAILAHKVDLLKSGSSAHASAGNLAINRVKTVLERELEKRRQSQSGGVHIEALGQEGENSELGGLTCGEKEDAPFRFDEWDGGEVSFLATSTISANSEKGETGLVSLSEWLEETM